MVDRFSVRKIILSSMSLCIIGTLGFLLTKSYLLACFFRALTGISNAFCFLSCMVLAYRFFPQNRQAFINGCVITMAFCGGVVAHLPLAYLNGYIGWRKTLFVDVILGFFILSWLVFTIKDRSPAQPLKSEASRGLTGLGEVLSTKQNWLAAIYTACLNLPIMVLCALWGAGYLNEVHHLNPIKASFMMSLILVGSMLGGPLFGFFSDKLRRRKPLMLLGALLSLGVILFLMGSVDLSFMALSWIFFALGLFTSSQILSYPLIAESNNAQHTGLATAMASIVITGGGGLAQVIFGLLLQQHAGDLTHHFASVDFQYAMIMLPVAAVISCIMIFGLDETYCSRSWSH